MKAILSRPKVRASLKMVLMLPFLVLEVLREKDYYHAHGGFSLAPILLGLMLAAMAVASLLYWLVAAVRRRMGRRRSD